MKILPIRYVIIFLSLFVLALLFVNIDSRYTTETTTQTVPQYKDKDSDTEMFDLKNSIFVVGESSIELKNGFAKTDGSLGPSYESITRYFGNESYGDLDGNGLVDAAFLVTQQIGGGTGTFYYAVVKLQFATTSGTYFKSTNAFFVGDRIAPQNTRIQSDARELSVFYAERKPNEPFSESPSQATVLMLKVNNEGKLEGLLK